MAASVGAGVAAADRGITRFDAEVMFGNRAMLGLFEGAGFAVRRRGSCGELTVSLDINPTEAVLERIDVRDHFGAVAALRPILAPTARWGVVCSMRAARSLTHLTAESGAAPVALVALGQIASFFSNGASTRMDPVYCDVGAAPELRRAGSRDAWGGAQGRVVS